MDHQYGLTIGLIINEPTSQDPTPRELTRERQLSLKGASGPHQASIPIPVDGIVTTCPDGRLQLQNSPANRVDLNQPLKGDESAPQPKATRFVAPSFVSCQLELPTSPLNLAFSFLLVLHVRVHFRPVQTNRINTISTNPKSITPVRSMLEFPKLIEHPSRRPTLHHPYKCQY